jgi:hypothetical protein
MAHFAQLDDNNKVTQVITVSDNDIKTSLGNESEEMGKELCSRLFGGNWIQTSFNKKFRKHYAGIGYYYDSKLDAFVPPKPFESFILNEETCMWEAPKPRPVGDKYYFWDESVLDWKEMSSPILS